MPATFIVTPGFTVPGTGTRITPAVLNALGSPGVTLVADGSIGTSYLNMTEISAALSQSARAVNFLPGGLFPALNWRNTAGVTCVAGTGTENAPGWKVQSTGADVTFARNALVYDDGTNPPAASYSAEIRGAAGLTAVELRTELDADSAGMLREEEVTISVRFHNATGAAQTPRLILRTWSGSAWVERYNTAFGTSTAHLAWSRPSWTIDTATITDWQNGVQVCFGLTTATMDTTGKYILFHHAQLESGAAVTPYVRPVNNTFDERSGMVGQIMAWPGATVPEGWLPCEGQSLLRTDYGQLFDVLSTTWGAVDATHFTLPDLRGRTLMHPDALAGRVLITDAACTYTGGNTTMTVTSTANLLQGYGVAGTDIPADTTITRILSETTLQLSANPTSSHAAASVTFSKLGGVLPVLGSYGLPLTEPRHGGISLYGCTASSGSNILTLPGVWPSTGLHPGSVVSGTGIAAGTKVVAFHSTTPSYTLLLSQNTTAAVVATQKVTFAPASYETDGWIADQENCHAPAIDRCTWGLGTSTIEMPNTAPAIAGLIVGMEITGPGLPASGLYVTTVAGASIGVSAAHTTAQTAPGATLTFSTNPGRGSATVAGREVAVVNFIIRAI